MGTSPAVSSALFAELFDAAPDGIVVVDGSGTIMHVNDQLTRLFGYTPDELIGRPMEILLPERFQLGHVSHRAAYATTPSRRPMGAGLPLFGRRKGGEEFPVDVSLSTIRVDGDVLVTAFVRDVTARRRAEQELKASEERYRTLVETVADHAIYMLDPGGRVMTWNAGAERIKGYTAEEILGAHYSVFFLPEDTAAGDPERLLERAAADGRSHVETWRLRADGTRFWAESTLTALRDENGTLRGFSTVTRDRTESRQARARLEAVNELNRALVDRKSERDLLGLIVARARSLVSGSVGLVYLPTEDNGYVVRAADGERAADRLGAALHDTTVLDSGRPEVVHGAQEGVAVPLISAGEIIGVLLVGTPSGRPPLQGNEIDVLQLFAMQAAVAIASARTQREVEQLRLVTERERIARDLHDTVIQRLFAVGLALEATARRPAAEVQDRLRQAVSDIDDTIRSIRSSIFGLELRTEEASSLRRDVLDVVSDATPALGFEPSVRFDGPVDTLAHDAIAEDLLATLREALSNVARHARATSADVTVHAGKDLVLTVQDDGVGLPAEIRAGGHGLGNMRERAELQGGGATIEPRQPRGTRITWSVPVRGT